YAVPAVLCVFIGFRPHVTGRQESLTDCTETTSSFLFCTFEEKSLVFFLMDLDSAVFFLRAPVGKLRVSTAVAITVFPIVAWLYYHINKELRSDWPSHCKTAI
uniref:Uncharacterized protein n=1 Tax=Poecilia latipinna TaxID=48699 RepID=A0A3B3TNC9_9TELE